MAIVRIWHFPEVMLHPLGIIITTTVGSNCYLSGLGFSTIGTIANPGLFGISLRDTGDWNSGYIWQKLLSSRLYFWKDIKYETLKWVECITEFWQNSPVFLEKPWYVMTHFYKLKNIFEQRCIWYFQEEILHPWYCQHNLFSICSKIILTSSGFEKNCCILKFVAVKGAAFLYISHFLILILLSSLHILWRFPTFPFSPHLSRMSVFGRSTPHFCSCTDKGSTRRRKQSHSSFSHIPPFILRSVSLFEFPSNNARTRVWHSPHIWNCFLPTEQAEGWVQQVSPGGEFIQFPIFPSLVFTFLQFNSGIGFKGLVAFRRFGGEEEISPVILIFASILSEKYCETPI